MSTYDFIVKITDNSSGTVTLTSAPWQVRKYDLRAGRREEKEVDNVHEVRLRDGSAANNLDELRTLNDLLRNAHERNQNHDKRIDPVYVIWQEAAGGDEWRSELMTAKADWLQDALELGYWQGDTQFADLELTRANWWEGTEAQIPISNPNGTANTSGLRVYNCNDAAVVDTSFNRHNYFDVPGTAIIGDIPGITRLEMVNGYSTDLTAIWIGQNFTNTDFDPVIEAESGTGGSTVASALNSGGSYQSYTLASGTEAEIDHWTLSSANLDDAGGGFFRVIPRMFGTPNEDVRYRIAFYVGAQEVWKSGLVSLDPVFAHVIRPLAIVQLPPWVSGLTSLKAIDMYLFGLQNTGTDATIILDFIELMPIDGWRHILVRGGVAQTERIVDDGILDYLYIDDGSGSDKLGHLTGFGNHITLEPSTDQRLYFMQQANLSNIAEINRYLTIKLHYRPRRLTL